LIHAARKQNTGCDALAREIAQRLDAIHAGHLQVQKNQAGLARAQLLAETRSTVRGDDLAADPFADLLDQLQKVDLIVDDKQ
jgi:hypothetical protein